MSLNDENSPPFPASRAALIAGGITLFLFVFRPFDLSISNVVEALIVFGFAPLNFIAILAVHGFLPRTGRLRPMISTTAILTANFAYLIFWSTRPAIFSLVIDVALVAALTIGAIVFWNRQRSLKAEIVELKQSALSQGDGVSLLVLKGEDKNEILRVMPSALLFVQAQGNYVEVHFEKSGEVKTATLRATLANIAEQVGEPYLKRCHRSFLVNLNAALRLVSDRNGMRIEFEDQRIVPVSRSFRETIRSAAQQ